MYIIVYVFEFSEDNKIKPLTIIYDMYNIREAYESVKS